MRIGLLIIMIVFVAVAAAGAMKAFRPLPASEASVEQQAQVPAPMGAMWCKSADNCPRRHVRRPD